MALGMKVTGKLETLMVLGSLLSLMVPNTKAIGLKANTMGRDSIRLPVGPSMTENGSLEGIME